MRIGEVSALSGVSVRMLRHYDALGLVRPRARTSAGYREYSDGDLRRILHVEALRALGLSLGEVSSALEDPAFAPAATVEDLIRRTRERIAAEEELLRRLQGIAAAEPSGWEDVLGVVGLLRALQSPHPHDRQRVLLDAAARAESGPALTAFSPAQLVEAFLAEDETNVAGTLRWALRQVESRGADETATRGPDRRPQGVDETRGGPPVAGDPKPGASGASGAEGHEAEDLPAHDAAVRPAAQGTEEDVLGLLRGALRSEDGERRRRAVSALEILDGEAVTELLLAELRVAAADLSVRTSLALALAARGRTEAVDPLIAAVLAGERDVEAAEVLGGLAREGFPVVAAVLGHAQSLPRGAARLRLVQALGELPREAVDGVLSAMAEGDDPAEARIARYLLSRSPHHP
ncbi:MerR family transcriptional regulator [Brevibacterium salitolerans]|uniref:MerR family transcriptional regulator n=1 Tax=Brevibacterium salitolerans TaxID=1403566 RepID=A0ABN2WL72_9MICO